MLSIGLITLPINIYRIESEIRQFYITGITYEKARKNHNISVFENAAIQIDIAKQNRWLISNQYWNQTIFDIWIPDKIMNLKPLE